MNAGFIVICFLLMPILIIGFFQVIEDQRKRAVRGGLNKALRQLSKGNDLLDIEFFRDKVIAIDNKNKKLIYARYRKKAIDQFCIDLKLLAFCRMDLIMDESSKSMKEFFLEVICKDNNKTIYRLNFYDRTFDNIRATAALLKKAQQWKDKINFHRKSLTFDNQFEYVL